MSKKLFALLIAVTFLIAACSGGQADASAIATAVAATLQAGAPTEAPLDLVANLGTVQGTICYPSEGHPALNLYLQNNQSAEPALIAIAENQGSFSAEMAPGTYTAYAWTLDHTFGGSYSQAVPCGLSVECTDHSLISFEVTAGGTTSGIDVCDWYGNPGDVPTPPGVVVGLGLGSISGTLIYPSEGIPEMQVVAYRVMMSEWYMVETQQGQSEFLIEGLPAGEYYVVAYLSGSDYGGGYTPAVACGLSVDCTDHSLTTVVVSAGQTTAGVMPHDWYAPEGSFPPNPTP
jgi:hypothetical protein